VVERPFLFILVVVLAIQELHGLPYSKKVNHGFHSFICFHAILKIQSVDNYSFQQEGLFNLDLLNEPDKIKTCSRLQRIFVPPQHSTIAISTQAISCKEFTTGFLAMQQRIRNDCKRRLEHHPMMVYYIKHGLLILGAE
jgi:hypothetical protein